MSMTTVYALDAMLTLPCGSVALTVKVCEPSLRAAVGVNVHAPLLLAVAVPICVAPSKMAMMLLASAVPESVGVVSLVTPLVGIFFYCTDVIFRADNHWGGGDRIDHNSECRRVAALIARRIGGADR